MFPKIRLQYFCYCSHSSKIKIVLYAQTVQNSAKRRLGEVPTFVHGSICGPYKMKIPYSATSDIEESY